MNEYHFHSLEEYQNETDIRAVCAMALSDWGYCYAGEKPPAHFGEAMVIAGQKMGISATPDNVTEYSKRFLP